jgi:Amt family ammonium transporter
MAGREQDMTSVMELGYALDTFYFLVTGAFVMWMAAGFAMLEAGLVRSRHTAEILAKNLLLYSVACIMYLICGYQIMYGDSSSSIIPSLGFLIGEDNTVEAVTSGGEDAPYYSNLADFFFQVVFVATAMSIVSGAVAERMKLWSFLAFAVVMTGVIYPVQGYWKWGGGFLDGLGFADFAGSGVVHLTGACAALAGVLLLGPRMGKYGPGGETKALPGANMPLATLGTFILWFGWFGFNGGSELKVSDVGEANAVAMVFVNTNTAAAGGSVAAALLSRILFRKADLTMILTGAIAGLVAITAEPLTPTPLVATLIGGVGGIIVVFAIMGLDKLKIDDPVGAIPAHGAVGMWGLLAVPLTNEDATFTAQLIGIGTIIGWVFLTSAAVWLVLKKTVGIRVSESEEIEGLDMVEIGLQAYPEFTVGAEVVYPPTPPGHGARAAAPAATGGMSPSPA